MDLEVWRQFGQRKLGIACLGPGGSYRRGGATTGAQSRSNSKFTGVKMALAPLTASTIVIAELPGRKQTLSAAHGSGIGNGRGAVANQPTICGERVWACLLAGVLFRPSVPEYERLVRNTAPER